MWIGDDRREGSDIVSTDPGKPDRVVAEAAAARPGDVDAALGAARPWTAPAAERAAVLLRAAQWLRDRRLEVAALAVRECAKPWPEADADVCEAIDFLEYYARGAIDLAQGAPLLQPPGERNELRWDRARHRRGDLAVELPGRDRVRDDRRGAGHRQRGDPQAGRAVARLRVRAHARAARVRRAGERARAAARRGRRRRRARARPARAHDRVHRLQQGRARHRARRRRDPARPEAPQARRRRDGRQELRDRRLRRRPRRRRARARQVRVPVRRPEVLGRRARALPRGDPRRARRAPGGRDRGARTSARRRTSRSTSAR